MAIAFTVYFDRSHCIWVVAISQSFSIFCPKRSKHSSFGRKYAAGQHLCLPNCWFRFVFLLDRSFEEKNLATASASGVWTLPGVRLGALPCPCAIPQVFAMVFASRKFTHKDQQTVGVGEDRQPECPDGKTLHEPISSPKKSRD